MLLYISVFMNSSNARLLSGKFPKHAKISRGSTTITFIAIVVPARDILACPGKVAGKESRVYEFMLYRNVQ